MNRPDLTPEQKLEIWKRDKYICQYCGKDGLESFDSWCSMTVDHVDPSGDNSKDNLKTACFFCNSKKHTEKFDDIEKIPFFILEKKSQEIGKFYTIRRETRGC